MRRSRHAHGPPCGEVIQHKQTYSHINFQVLCLGYSLVYQLLIFFYSKISYNFSSFYFALCTLYVVIKSFVNCLIDYISLQAVKLPHFCMALNSTNTIRITYRISRVVIDVS